MCLKVGGWVRQQIGYGINGNLTNGALVANINTRATQDFAMRSRGYITADARNQTEYGTVRSYIAVGLSQGWATGTTTGSDIADRRRPAGAPTARSSSGPASPSVCRSRSSTSTPARRRRSSAAISTRRKTPATAARPLLRIPRSSATASRPRWASKLSAMPASSRRPVDRRDHDAAPPSQARGRSIRTSSPTCASTSLGAPRRSWAPCMTPAASTLPVRTSTPARRPPILSAGRSAQASSCSPRWSARAITFRRKSTTRRRRRLHQRGRRHVLQVQRRRWRHLRLRHAPATTSSTLPAAIT